MKVELGLGGVVAGESWNRIRVRVTNRGADFRGTLRLRGIRDRIHPVIPETDYEADIELPGRGTTTRELVFPVIPAGWTEVQVSLRGDGFRKTFSLDPPLLDNHSYRILAVGERVPDLSALLEEIDSLLKKQDEDNGRVRGARLGTIESRELPDFVAALDPFQVVILWETKLAEAAPEAIEALGRWVETGGVLIAFPPAAAGWGVAMPEKMRRLLGIDLESDIIVREGVVTSRRGLGSITTFSKRPEGRSFPARAVDPELYRRLDSSLKRPVSIMGRGQDRSFLWVMQQFSGLLQLYGHPVPKRDTVSGALLLYLLGGFLLPTTSSWPRRSRSSPL